MKAKRGKSGKDSTSALSHQGPSTPIFLNQNSNSCSNDTNLSAVSTSTANHQLQQKQNPIYLNEAKIRNYLKELQTYVKSCQLERDKNEPNLTNIMKTHEKLKKDEKGFYFFCFQLIEFKKNLFSLNKSFFLLSKKTWFNVCH